MFASSDHAKRARCFLLHDLNNNNNKKMANKDEGIFSEVIILLIENDEYLIIIALIKIQSNDNGREA